MKLTTWSFSRWKVYDTCPRQAYYKYIEKLKEPEGPALARGTRIHQLAQDYIEQKLQVLPSELAKCAAQIQALRDSEAKCEVEWGFTPSWAPTGWMAEDVWLRVKADAFAVRDSKMQIVDFKTGREYPDHRKQLSLYALSSFIMFPEVQSITSELYYLDAGAVTTVDFEREEQPDILSVWQERCDKMLSDETFDPKPNPKCKWCHFRASNGGPCDNG